MYIPFGETEAHVEKLKIGLAKLGPQFLGRICGICHGHTRYEQRYCDGPNGSFRMNGECDYCGATGLQVAHKPAPMSVVNQVLTAAA